MEAIATVFYAAWNCAAESLPISLPNVLARTRSVVRSALESCTPAVPLAVGDGERRAESGDRSHPQAAGACRKAERERGGAGLGARLQPARKVQSHDRRGGALRSPAGRK